MPEHVQTLGGTIPTELQERVAEVARTGATPLVVSDGALLLGVIALSDVVKQGIKERFARLREMGVKTVMITGDNKLTAAAIAAEAGVDDYVAEARPEDKLARDSRRAGCRSAWWRWSVTAPTMPRPWHRSDVGLAMNSGYSGSQGGRQYGRP